MSCLAINCEYRMGGDENKPVRDKATAEHRVNEAKLALNAKSNGRTGHVLDAGELYVDPSGEWLFRCICSKTAGGRKGKGVLKLRRSRELVCHVNDKDHFHVTSFKGSASPSSKFGFNVSLLVCIYIRNWKFSVGTSSDSPSNCS
jgi:hypothetical protein